MASTHVIVLAYNRVDLTVPCVESILEHTNPDLYELLVLDNGSTDDTERIVGELGVKVARVDPNVGFSAGNNIAAELAGLHDPDNLVFANNDIVAHPGWLEPMLAALDDPEVGIVGSKLVYPNGQIQHAGVHFSADHALYGHHYLTEQPAGYVRAVTAACMLIRRDLFNAVGGFDPIYRQGNEDCDLALKVRDAGWKIWYEPASVLTHHESQCGPSRWEHTGENIRIFTERWLHRPDLWA